jgi:putative DNA primase/helicase
MSYHRSTLEAAKGKWRGILLEFGLPEACLKDKHGPCPLCQSEKNFRWDNKDGSGSYICTCGAGNGSKLAEAFTGKTFKQVYDEIDLMIGNIKVDAVLPKREMSDEDRRFALREVYAATKQVAPGDLADKYLTARGLGELIYPKALRFAGALRDGEGGVRPCMVATVTDTEGKPVSLHRTFLRPDGLAKAEMEAPRKMMPGSLPDGASVRLSDGPSAALGIAEGVETALSASALYGLPVWAAINAAMLAKWTPPDWCEEVAIFGDNDPKFGGQAAAYALAHKLAVKGLAVTVHIPSIAGTDWNDIRMKGKAQ